jgi:transcriptional/translational regulatory protein YebC/TACO1
MITTPLEDFHKVQLKLQELGVEPESAELQRIAKDTLDLTLEQGLQIMKIIEEFEDDDDVQSVYHNLNISDELSEAMD